MLQVWKKVESLLVIPHKWRFSPFNHEALDNIVPVNFPFIKSVIYLVIFWGIDQQGDFDIQSFYSVKVVYTLRVTDTLQCHCGTVILNAVYIIWTDAIWNLWIIKNKQRKTKAEGVSTGCGNWKKSSFGRGSMGCASGPGLSLRKVSRCWPQSHFCTKHRPTNKLINKSWP